MIIIFKNSVCNVQCFCLILELFTLNNGIKNKNYRVCSPFLTKDYYCYLKTLSICNTKSSNRKCFTTIII